MSRFTEYKKWPPRLAAPTATVYQLVTLSLVFGLLPSYHCQLGQIAESAGRWQAPLHPCNSPRCQRAICPTPVQVERTQKVRLEPSPTGLRHSQARWRLSAWLSSDPAVSPKRQLNQSCSAAHILNPDLVRINNGMDLLVSSLATHCTFHGADTILRKMLHSDLMKFKPRAPPRKDKEKAKTDQSFARSSSFPLPQSHKIWNNFSGLQRRGDSQPEQTEQRTKHLALRSDFPLIPESGSHLGGKGKILEPDLLL